MNRCASDMPRGCDRSVFLSAVDAIPVSAFRLPFGHSYFTSLQLRRARLNQTGQNGPNMLHLIVVDGVTHARIDAFGRVAAQAAKDSRRLLDSRQRNVGIYIAATNEHRRARQRARVVSGCARWAD
jgi:hypothetical protein